MYVLIYWDFFFVLARRAREFYNVQQSTLCDICEGVECDKTCKNESSAEEETTTISSELESVVSNSTMGQ